MKPDSVLIVMDRECGERLPAMLRKDTPTWIIESAPNTAVVNRLSKERPSASRHAAVTLISLIGNMPAEDLFIDALDDIELNVGLEVIGLQPTTKVCAALADRGLIQIKKTDIGFLARRTVLPAL